MKYKCEVCNIYEYNIETGDAEFGIDAGVKPEDFSDDWQCPVCQADKTHLILEE